MNSYHSRRREEQLALEIWKEKYQPVTVVQDMGRTFLDHSDREIHKENFRRK